MSFALFVLYLLMVFVRPAEHFVELREVPFMEIASILALVGAALAILMGSRPPLRAGQVPLLLGIVAGTLGEQPSPELVSLYGTFRLMLRARLSVAHLLQTPVRHPEKWRPLAARYVSLAKLEASVLEPQKI